MPLPEHIDKNKVVTAISAKKDVDGFRTDSYFKPCTPKGIVDWLEFNDFDFNGKHAVVIGRSKIVGLPLVNMLIERGSTVTCCNSKTKSLSRFIYNADLVISAIGKPKYFDKFDFVSFGKDVAEGALTQLKAVDIPGGVYDVVIHNAFGGVIFHEACGHSLEATSVAKNLSVFANKLGEKLTAILLGNNIDHLANELIYHGAGFHNELKKYCDENNYKNIYSKAIVEGNDKVSSIIGGFEIGYSEGSTCAVYY